MSICVNVLDEMMKNKDDRELFLDMYCDFTALYEDNICQYFFKKILIPGLQNVLAVYNEAHPERDLSFKNDPEKYEFGPRTAIHFVNKYWPDFILYFEIPTDLSPLIGAYTTNPGPLTKEALLHLKKSYNNLPNVATKHSNQGAAWAYYNEPYSNFYSRGTMGGVVSDVVNHKVDPTTTNSPFANRYIEDLMTVANTIDKMVDDKMI